MQPLRQLITCLAAAIGLSGAPALADFETVEAPAGVYTDPFSISPVSGVLRLSFGYDDNVLLVPDLPPFYPPGARRESPYFALRFDGTWSRPINASTIVGVTGELSGVYYTRSQNPLFGPLIDSPSDYSRFALHPKLFLSHRMEMGSGGTLTLTPSYGFRLEDGARVRAHGLRSHQLRFDARYSPDSRQRFDAHLLYAHNDFEVAFPLAPTSNRDANYFTAGLSYRIKPAPSYALTFGAEVQHNDAKGSDWEFDGYKLFAELETHLGRAFFGTFGASYSDRDYKTGFNYLLPAIIAPRNDQQVLTLSAGVLKILDARRAVEANLIFDDYSSNSPNFDGDRSRIEFSYIVSLP